jgi:hypothetical protein
VSVDPEQPELNGDVVPLRWGIGGPVIGSAILKENGVVEGVITDRKYIDVLKPDIPDSYSIFDINELRSDPEQSYLFETPTKFHSKTTIHIKKEETDGNA